MKKRILSLILALLLVLTLVRRLRLPTVRSSAASAEKM